MKKKETLRLYHINLDYIKYLHYNFDKKVQYNEEQGNEYNLNRPYIGIVLDINNMQYFAPLEHPRPEHQLLKNNTHIFKIKNGEQGIIGLNNMIPVHKELLIEFDINKDKNKHFLIEQYVFCKKHIKHIKARALTIYNRRVHNPNPFEKNIYCDFKKLEKGLIKYCRQNNIDINLNESNKETQPKIKLVNPNSNQSNQSKQKNTPKTIAERIAAAKKAAIEQAAASFDKPYNNNLGNLEK